MSGCWRVLRWRWKLQIAKCNVWFWMSWWWWRLQLAKCNVCYLEHTECHCAGTSWVVSCRPEVAMSVCSMLFMHDFVQRKHKRLFLIQTYWTIPTINQGFLSNVSRLLSDLCLCLSGERNNLKLQIIQQKFLKKGK